LLATAAAFATSGTGEGSPVLVSNAMVAGTVPVIENAAEDEKKR
jgi:hypothetical protein